MGCGVSKETANKDDQVVVKIESRGELNKTVQKSLSSPTFPQDVSSIKSIDCLKDASSSVGLKSSQGGKDVNDIPVSSSPIQTSQTNLTDKGLSGLQGFQENTQVSVEDEAIDELSRVLSAAALKQASDELDAELQVSVAAAEDEAIDELSRVLSAAALKQASDELDAELQVSVEPAEHEAFDELSRVLSAASAALKQASDELDAELQGSLAVESAEDITILSRALSRTALEQAVYELDQELQVAAVEMDESAKEQAIAVLSHTLSQTALKQAKSELEAELQAEVKDNNADDKPAAPDKSQAVQKSEPVQSENVQKSDPEAPGPPSQDPDLIVKGTAIVIEEMPKTATLEQKQASKTRLKGKTAQVSRARTIKNASKPKDANTNKMKHSTPSKIDVGKRQAPKNFQSKTIASKSSKNEKLQISSSKTSSNRSLKRDASLSKGKQRTQLVSKNVSAATKGQSESSNTLHSTPARNTHPVRKTVGSSKPTNVVTSRSTKNVPSVSRSSTSGRNTHPVSKTVGSSEPANAMTSRSTKNVPSVSRSSTLTKKPSKLTGNVTKRGSTTARSSTNTSSDVVKRVSKNTTGASGTKLPESKKPSVSQVPKGLNNKGKPSISQLPKVLNNKGKASTVRVSNGVKNNVKAKVPSRNSKMGVGKTDTTSRSKVNGGSSKCGTKTSTSKAAQQKSAATPKQSKDSITEMDKIASVNPNKPSALEVNNEKTPLNSKQTPNVCSMPTHPGVCKEQREKSLSQNLVGTSLVQSNAKSRSSCLGTKSASPVLVHVPAPPSVPRSANKSLTSRPVTKSPRTLPKISKDSSLSGEIKPTSLETTRPASDQSSPVRSSPRKTPSPSTARKTPTSVLQHRSSSFSDSSLVPSKAKSRSSCLGRKSASPVLVHVPAPPSVPRSASKSLTSRPIPKSSRTLPKISKDSSVSDESKSTSLDTTRPASDQSSPVRSSHRKTPSPPTTRKTPTSVLQHRSTDPASSPNSSAFVKDHSAANKTNSHPYLPVLPSPPRSGRPSRTVRRSSSCVDNTKVAKRRESATCSKEPVMKYLPSPPTTPFNGLPRRPSTPCRRIRSAV